jgi:hypothetical protein
LEDKLLFAIIHFFILEEHDSKKFLGVFLSLLLERKTLLWDYTSRGVTLVLNKFPYNLLFLVILLLKFVYKKAFARRQGNM